MQKNNVFISWSGENSKSFALFLHDWIPSIISTAAPFCSPNMEKGSRWPSGINDALENCDFGIFCLTQENMSSPWLLFEAGAISKLESGRVATLLLSPSMKPTDVTGPLAQFQHTEPIKSEIFELIKTLNGIAGGTPNAKSLDMAFDRAWPDFEKALLACQAIQPEGTSPPERSQEDMLEEVLTICRSIDKNIKRFTSPHSETLSLDAFLVKGLPKYLDEPVSNWVTKKIMDDLLRQQGANAEKWVQADLPHEMMTEEEARQVDKKHRKDD